MKTRTYNEIVDAHADSLYRYLLKNMRSQADAEDAMQIVFARLWEHRTEVDVKRVKSWLFTVGHRVMIDAFRKHKPTTPVLPIHLGSRAEEERWDMQEILDRALSHLSTVQRQLVTLRDYEGYSYAEMAKMVNLTESQVKVYLFRARKKMRSFLIAERGAASKEVKS
jgi:RNA polymerase sigma-70 factor (ECF subfamily)